MKCRWVLIVVTMVVVAFSGMAAAELEDTEIILDLSQGIPETWDHNPDLWLIEQDGDEYILRNNVASGENWFAMRVADDRIWADYEATFQLQMAKHNFNMYMRWDQATNSSYRFFFQDDVFFRKYDAGDWTNTVVNPYRLNPNAWYDVKVVADGERYDVYLNGDLVLTVEDDMLLEGKVVLASWVGNIAIKNFEIRGTSRPAPEPEEED